MQIEESILEKMVDHGQPSPSHHWLRYEGVKMMSEVNRLRREAILYISRRPLSLGEIGMLDSFISDNFSQLAKKTNYVKVRNFKVDGRPYRVETYQHPDQPIGTEKIARLVRPINDDGIVIAHYFDYSLKGLQN